MTWRQKLNLMVHCACKKGQITYPYGRLRCLRARKTKDAA